MIILFAVPILLLSALFHFLPGWTRPDLFFAVTVDPAFRRAEAGRRILLRYRLILWSFTAGAAGLLLATGFEGMVLVQAAGFAIALAVARRQTFAHAVPPSAIVEVDLAAPPETLPGGPLVALLPVASLAVLALWAARNWDRLPARLPVHWGLHGPDRWIARTTIGVYGFVAVHAAICVGLGLLAWGILHWSPRAVDDRRFRRRNVWMILLISYFPAAQAWIVLLQPAAMGLWWGGALTAVIAIFLILLVHSGQGNGGSPAGDRTPDTCWKWGIFYFNRADSSVFVAKRFGIGYTVNFGNRWSWAVLAVLLAAALARGLLR